MQSEMLVIINNTNQKDLKKFIDKRDLYTVKQLFLRVVSDYIYKEKNQLDINVINSSNNIISNDQLELSRIIKNDISTSLRGVDFISNGIESITIDGLLTNVSFILHVRLKYLINTKV